MQKKDKCFAYREMDPETPMLDEERETETYIESACFLFCISLRVNIKILLKRRFSR